MQTHRWVYTLAAIGIGLVSVAILLGLPAAAQSPVPTMSGPAASSLDEGMPLALPASPSAVLYDQYDNAGTSSHSSQNFEPAFDAYDDFLADDFVVPPGAQWSINLVEVQGGYFNGLGPADSMNVFIYTEAITLPGALVAARTGISYTHTVNDFALPLSSPIVLGPGKYWMSVQANQNYSLTGQWGWTARSITSNLPAAWQNPGGGFGVCPTWGLRTNCIGNLTEPDQVFRLSGESSPYVPLTCNTTNPWVLRSYLPLPVYGASAASDGTYAYAFGGYTFITARDITQTMRYDPAANAWMELNPLPDARTMASAVYAPINNKLYVFGGEIARTGKVFSSTLIYDISSNTWANGAPMPNVRGFMSAGYYNGKVYLAGGYNTGSVTDENAQTWEYNITADTWLTKTSMPEPLGGAVSAVVDGHLYVIGGRDGTVVARSQTFDYDIVHDTWSSRLNVPYGVNVAGAAVLQNKIWVIGGGTPFLAGEGSPSSTAINAPETISTTLIYDPAADSWTGGPTLNVPRSFIGATNIGNYAVAIGGYSGSTSSGATEVTMSCPAVYFSAAEYSVNENAGTILIPVYLNPATDLPVSVNFTTVDGSATAGSDYTAVTVTLTFTPGVTSRTVSVPILNDTLYEDNETVYLYLSNNIYATIVPPNPAVLKIIDNDSPLPLTCGFPAPGPWILRNFLPQPVYGPAAANDGTYAYVLGGYSFQSSQDITQTVRYNILTNAWTALAPLPKAVSMGSAVYAPINDKLYVFGGELFTTNLVYSSTLIYDIASDAWTTGTPMPDVRAFMGAGYYNGKIYLVGGYSTGSVIPAHTQTWEYDVMANTWTAKADMPEGLGGPAAGVVNGHLYVIGGRDGSTAARKQTYDYDIALNTWSSRMDAPYGVNVPGAAVLHGKLWVIGGGDPFLAAGGSASLLDFNSPQTIHTTRIYDPQADNWINGPDLNILRSFAGATGFGNFVLSFGGYNGSTSTGAAEVSWMCPSGYLPVVVYNGP